MVAFNFSLFGIGPNVTLGSGGPRVRDDGAGVVEFRNAADAAYTQVSFADGSGDDDGATIRQLNAALFGLFWIVPALTSAIINIVLSGEQTIDGELTSTSRVLLTGQTDPLEDGVWVTAAGAWTRPGDFDTGEAAASKTLMVSEGTVREDTQWTCTAPPGTDIIGTDPVPFAQIAGGGSGVTSLADGAGSGVSIIDTGGPTGAITLNTVEGVQGISAAVVSADIEIGLSTGAVIIRRVSFGFADEGTDVNIGAVAPVGFAFTAGVDVTVVFDGVASDPTVGQAAVPDQ